LASYTLPGLSKFLFGWVAKVLAAPVEPTWGLFGCLYTVGFQNRFSESVSLPLPTHPSLYITADTPSHSLTPSFTARLPLFSPSSICSLESVAGEPLRWRISQSPRPSAVLSFIARAAMDAPAPPTNLLRSALRRVWTRPVTRRRGAAPPRVTTSSPTTRLGRAQASRLRHPRYISSQSSKP
jgi:hypothetical protein